MSKQEGTPGGTIATDDIIAACEETFGKYPVRATFALQMILRMAKSKMDYAEIEKMAIFGLTGVEENEQT